MLTAHADRRHRGAPASRGPLASADAILLAALCLIGLPAPGQAGEEEAPGIEERLAIHGFLSQAYGLTDGNQILGITEEGTTDYRTAALQVRYTMSERGSFALQLSHERLGESPLARFREDVELDWVFYQHEISDSTEVKVGRVPIPLGIYNEILDVGTVLPFYRPPVAFTSELAFSSETVDGAVLSHAFAADTAWPLDLDLYYGRWDSIEIFGGQTGKAVATDAVGLQAWLRTPVQGLRFGLAGQQFTLRDGIIRPPGQEDRARLWQASVDGVFSRLTVRTEYRRVDYRRSPAFAEAQVDAYYAELALRLTSRLALTVHAARVELLLEDPFFHLDFELDRDLAAGLKVAFSSAVVAKLEVHWNRGTMQVESPIDPTGATVPETTYGILSLSTSF
jgi:hypothetical protein